MLSSNKSFAAMHTLASIYAAEGKTTEARKVLEEAMYAGNMAQPNSECWYVLGWIYEQYGMNEAAIHAFSHVESDDNPATERLDTLSTYGLAQDQIKKLKASTPPPASSRAKT
jgi:Tfp pilus assembly protein PilF